MSLLSVQNLKKVYTSKLGTTSVTALKNVNFNVEEGEFIAIMGESGSGKTTLLNILASLDKPTAGKVILNGIENCFPFSDQNKDLLCSRHTGREKIALKHDKMTHSKGHDDNGIFTSLSLVDRNRISQHQLIKLRHIVHHIPAVKIHGQLPFLHIYL